MTTQKKAAEAPQDLSKATEPDMSAARPLDGSGLGTGNPWDAAYGSNVAPKRDTTPVPHAEKGHLGTKADPTPPEEYTVAGVTAKAEQSKEA